MRHVNLCLFLLIAAQVAVSGSARADFGDCGNEAYINLFDERLTADTPFGCTELLRLPVNTSEGVRHIRIVQAFNADWAVAPAFTEQVADGVRATIAALGRIGPFKLNNVTIWLADELPRPPGTVGEVFDAEADARWIAGESIREAIGGESSDDIGDECGIVYYVFNVLTNPAATTAHEIFHCVEFATAGRERVVVTGRGTPGADWWVEGGAEWFGTFAVPDMPWLPDYVSQFDATSISTPLYSMSYEAVVFFLWLAGEYGPEAVLPFMKRMATSAEAQGAAMLEALSEEKWRKFAEDYVDWEIKDPRGMPIGIAAPTDDTWNFDESRTHDIHFDPFVIYRGVLTYECSVWETNALSGDANVSYQSFEGGEWGDMPPRIDAEILEEAAWIFAGVNVRSERMTLEVESSVSASCEPCAGSEEIDQCLVGVWRQTGGGPQEWMNRMLDIKTDIEVSAEVSSVSVLDEDGRYVTVPYKYFVDVIVPRRRGVRADGDGTASASGRWSVRDGQLAFCPSSEHVTGTVTVATPDVPARDFTFDLPGAGMPAFVDYSCSETQMKTSMPMMRDHIVTTYERIVKDATSGEVK